MIAMKNKIKSQKGASITFALLLFLVCAVISGVVIVAATTAAGRMSQQDEMDERYYAVTAAAKRLNEIFDGTEFKVEYTITDDGEPDFDSITGTGILFKASKDVVQRVLFGDKSSVIEPEPIIIPDDASKITCTINRKMNIDGRMEYKISALKKTTDPPNAGTYTVVVTFSPNLSAAVTDDPKKGHVDVKWKMLGAKKESATPKKTGDG